MCNRSQAPLASHRTVMFFFPQDGLYSGWPRYVVPGHLGLLPPRRDGNPSVPSKRQSSLHSDSATALVKRRCVFT